MAWRTVANFGSAVEAQFAADLLRDHGLQWRIPDEELGGLVPGGLLSWEGGPRLQVPEEQVDDARRLLRSVESSEAPSREEPHAAVPGVDWMHVIVGTLLLVVVGAIVVMQIF